MRGMRQHGAAPNAYDGKKGEATRVENRTLYWSVLSHPDWRLCLAAGDGGLMYVGAADDSLAELEKWAARQLPGWKLARHDEKLADAAEQIKAYLQGKRRSITCPLDLRGTPVQLEVWKALLAIPYGETRSYSEIAATIGKPSAARAVGAAVGANPMLIAVPCHRVVGKNGALTGYRGGLEMKKRLLELERQEIFAR